MSMARKCHNHKRVPHTNGRDMTQTQMARVDLTNFKFNFGCPFCGSGSVVVHSLFIVAPFVHGGFALGLCFVMHITV